MNVLALSYLFPNKKNPNYGIFVYNRLSAVKKLCNVKIVAPIPWFPFLEYYNYDSSDDVALNVSNTSAEIFRPRFFVIPKFLKWTDCLFYLIGTARTLLYINKIYRIDIVDIHWVYPDIISGYIFSRLINKPMVVTIRGKESICVGERSLRKKIIDYFLCRSDYIVCLSQELSDIVRLIGVDCNKISVISNGVDIDTFKKLDKSSCRDYLNLPMENKIILSVGSLIKDKGFHKIISCMPFILNKHPDTLLYIIGSVGPAGNFKNEIINLISSMSLQKNVILVGERPNTELCKWYNAADLFCLATKSEGSPNVLLEALACGCPVIASSVGGIPDILCNDIIGFTFDPDDNMSIQNAIIYFFEKKWDRSKISNYMEKFSWDWCAQKVVNIYKKITEKERK